MSAARVYAQTSLNTVEENDSTSVAVLGALYADEAGNQGATTSNRPSTSDTADVARQSAQTSSTTDQISAGAITDTIQPSETTHEPADSSDKSASAPGEADLVPQKEESDEQVDVEDSSSVQQAKVAGIPADSTTPGEQGASKHSTTVESDSNLAEDETKGMNPDGSNSRDEKISPMPDDAAKKTGDPVTAASDMVTIPDNMEKVADTSENKASPVDSNVNEAGQEVAKASSDVTGSDSATAAAVSEAEIADKVESTSTEEPVTSTTTDSSKSKPENVKEAADLAVVEHPGDPSDAQNPQAMDKLEGPGPSDLPDANHKDSDEPTLETKSPASNEPQMENVLEGTKLEPLVSDQDDSKSSPDQDSTVPPAIEDGIGAAPSTKDNINDADPVDTAASSVKEPLGSEASAVESEKPQPTPDHPSSTVNQATESSENAVVNESKSVTENSVKSAAAVQATNPTQASAQQKIVPSTQPKRQKPMDWVFDLDNPPPLGPSF